MKIATTVLALASLAALPALAQDQTPDQQQLAAEGKALIQEYAGALKAELMAGVQEGGPANAIAICNTRAPEIAAALSTDGWTIGRSSHKLRNPANAPDAFTAAAIEDFLAKIADGATPQQLVATGITEENGQRVFHMVKAIPTGKLCLNCHGATVAPGVEEKLAELYPEDQARGFEVGDMRGVFTLTKVLDD